MPGIKNLSAQNMTTEVVGPTSRGSCARITTDDAAAAGAVIVLEVDGGHGTYVPVDVWVAGAWAANITGPTQTGYADVPVVAAVRARRTDGTGSAANVVLRVNEG